MDGITITARLHPALHSAVLDIAMADDISPGQLIRDLLAREVARRQAARPPVRADERLVAPLRARLAPALAHGKNWDDIQSLLRKEGFALREAGGGLALHEVPSDRRVCKASELGFSYSRLMRRIGTPFPGHRHDWLADRMIAEAPSPPLQARQQPQLLSDDDDFDLIEDDWPPSLHTSLSETVR
jgi:hypothetical protein